MTKILLILISIPLVLAGPVGWLILPFLWLPTMLGDAVKQGVHAASTKACTFCKSQINKEATKCPACRMGI